MSDPLYKPHDEVLDLPHGRHTEFTAEAMFAWHLRRLLRWSSVLGWTPGQVKLRLRRALGEEPLGVRPRRLWLSTNERARIFARDGLRCRACGAERNLEIDHIHPVAHGGGDDPSNLQVLCRNCNAAKRDTVDAA